MKFSIIIPIYNVAPYLRECLDSVIGQTFTDWEAICVDDGSTDESGRIIEEYAQKDQRIKVIHQKNAGLSAARNSGMEIARGEWIAFLDGDDTLSPEWLSSYLRGIAESVDVIFGGVEQNGVRRVGYDSDIVNCGFSGELIEKYNLLQNCFAYSRMYRREFLSGKALRFDWGIVFAEDALFNLKALAVAKRVSFVFGEYYHYRFVTGSLSRRFHESEMYERNAVFFAQYLRTLCSQHSIPEAYLYYIKRTSLFGLKKRAVLAAFQHRASKKEKQRLVDILFEDKEAFKTYYNKAHFYRRIWALGMTLLPRWARMFAVQLFYQKL